MTIRRATVSDATHIAALERAAAFRPWSLESLTEQLGQATCAAWVTDHGHILTSIVADEAEVLTVAVIPAARRQGLGRRLIEQAMRYWVRQGVVRATLEVREGNHAAIALYEGLGWSCCGRRPGYYARDDGAEDALVMERSFATTGGS